MSSTCFWFSLWASSMALYMVSLATSFAPASIMTTFLPVRDDRDVEIARPCAARQLGLMHEFAVHKADLDARRQGRSRGCRRWRAAAEVPIRAAISGEQSWSTAHDRRHDGDVVAEVVGEERADGAVDDAAGQDALFAGTALAAVERAGDAADGVELLLKVNARGERSRCRRAGGRKRWRRQARGCRRSRP